MTISSSPCGFLDTLDPVANFPANSLAAFFRSIPNRSRPCTCVACLRLVRSDRLMVILAAYYISPGQSTENGPAQGRQEGKSWTYILLFLLLLGLFLCLLLGFRGVLFELFLLLDRQRANAGFKGSWISASTLSMARDHTARQRWRTHLSPRDADIPADPAPRATSCTW